MTQSELTVSVTPLPVKPGEVVLGKYRLERVLGTGGMGAVVAATHLQLEQLVAIKFLYTHAQNHPEALARFQREARAAVRLKSEHVARVTDVGQLESGAPFIVMEYLEGRDLAEIVEQQGMLPVVEAVDYVLQACEAIGEAHSLGIIHRDLKPKNLFLTKTAKGAPLVKVLDFGISKLMTATDDNLSLTKTQTVIGSPNYMSPEQLRSSRDVDVRADIWALGAILYELLTGRVPFPAETVTQLTAMVIADPPVPMESYRLDIPDGLKDIVLKCLSKNRDERYADVPSLASALLPFATANAQFALPSHSSQDALSTSSERTVDRPSFRVPGGETSSAWGDTQLAPPPTKKRWPLFAAIGAFVVVGLVAVAFGVTHKHASTEAQGAPAGPPQPTTADTLQKQAPTPSSPEAVLDVPTSRNLPPQNPLVSPTGGPVRPLPNTLAQPRRDAGTPAAAASTTEAVKPAPPPTGTGDDLPSVRH